MDHDERIAIAEEIGRKLLASYGERIVAVAVWGSVAQHADNEHSDLELWAITVDEVPPRELFQVYRGMAVQVSLTSVSRALAEAAAVGPYWPIDAAKWREYVGLIERDHFFTRLRRATVALPDDAVRQAIRERMVRLHEVAAKVRSSRLRDDRYGLLKAGRDLTYNTAIIIGLANRRYYPNTRELYPLSLRMPDLPDGYPELLDRAGGFATVESIPVHDAAMLLWDSLRAYVRRMGIEWESDDLRM